MAPSNTPQPIDGSLVILERAERTEHPHRLPGWFRRWRLDLQRGDIIGCTDCNRQWQLTVDSDGKYWRLVNV